MYVEEDCERNGRPERDGREWGMTVLLGASGFHSLSTAYDIESVDMTIHPTTHHELV